MAIDVFHQVGHNSKWNLESFEKDECGSGLIFSPVHQHRPSLEAIDKAVKQFSIFDPQFYLPSSQKPKLATYPFFPESISGDGFSTLNFHSLALQAAELCINFQLEQNFSKIVIPLRYLDQMYPDYVERQEAFSLNPFLEIISKKKIKKAVLLTLPVTHHMVESQAFRNQILNWITKYPEIHGIYLIACFERETKQIQSAEYLFELLKFVREIRNTGLTVLMGYQNTESLLFTLIDGVSLAIGSFENTRIFSIDKFVMNDEERRGPKPRIYLSGLLNWIQFDQAKILRTKAPALWKKVYAPTSYADATLEKLIDPTFNQPPLYKHHFLCITEQISTLAKLDIPGRFSLLKEWIDNASDLYSQIKKVPLPLEKHGDHSHLEHWLKAINAYEKEG